MHHKRHALQKVGVKLDKMMKFIYLHVETVYLRWMAKDLTKVTYIKNKICKHKQILNIEHEFL